MRYTAYIGLGSNLASSAGGPAETLRVAMERLAALGRVAAQSSLYRTAPVGYRAQPYFINAALVLETDLEPESLLEKMLAIERSLGRDRRGGVPKGPRTVDLDELLVLDASGQSIIYQSPTLTLPHPEMMKRRFVLQPLAEIAPDLRHPVLNKTIRELLDGLADDEGSEVARLND